MQEEYRFYGAAYADCPPVDSRYGSIRDPRELYDILSELWCEQTCAPRMRGDWSPSNKTLGQCSITAFLAQDIFGGKVFGVPLGDGNFHCYNAVGDCVFDLTSEQFGERKLDYTDNPEQSREIHFAKKEKYERYLLLKERLEKKLEKKSEKRSEKSSEHAGFEKRLEHSEEYIRRLSFGYNDDNTCSAIALAQALNYLSLQYGRAFVSDDWRSVRMGQLPARNSDNVKEAYPGTYALHRYLADDCDLCPVSYGDRITVPFEKYLKTKLGDNAGISLRWTLFPKASTIRANIDSNMPVLITTTLAGKLSWHTMTVYGYRIKPTGKMQLLVHTGWYSDVHADESAEGAYCSDEIWIDKRLATYGYYFTLK